jgi:hypothetical protein
MHWDGRQWAPSEYFERAIGVTDYDAGELRGVTAAGPNDVWAVGYYRNFSYKVDALVAHWDGKRWVRVPIPTGGSGRANGTTVVSRLLAGVSANAADDVWAVGSLGGSEMVNDEPLVLHWDGKKWSRDPVSKPSGVTMAALHRVSALSSGVWTAGVYVTPQVVSGGMIGIRDRSAACKGTSK